jgi:dihydrofolate synthase/folylpolyglutamate synthase
MAADRSAPSDPALTQLTGFLSRLGPWRQTRPDRAEGFERASAFFAMLGNPQDAVPTVHVAGTAGKGSVVAFVAGLLRAHGFRVGAHSSPHVYSLSERFQIDGQPVNPELLLRALAAIRPVAENMRESRYGAPSFFEATNAIAFHAFADRVDYSVIEAGIGGRYDSTNTITRGDKLAVITPIGLDHTEILGSTLAEITAQKAGILPVGGRAVVARPQCNEVAAALRAEQVRRGCAVELVDVATAVADAVTTGSGTTMRLPRHSRWPLGLVGSHQAGNAHLALRAVASIATWDGWTLDEQATADGLRSVRLPGRFERRILPDGRPVVLDGAHNPIKLAALVDTLRELHPGARFPWVVAFKQDKDLAVALQIIAPAASSIVATEFHAAPGDHPAGVSIAPERVAAAGARSGVLVTVEADPVKAVAVADADAEPGLPVVVSGSFHLLAAIARVCADSFQ